MATIKFWIYQNLIAIDQLLNAILLGSADETLSARAWRAEQKGRIFGKIFRPLIDFLLFFDYNHCYTSYLAEKERKHLHKDYR